MVSCRKMNEQQLNIFFVGEVEKRPVLYNFTLPGYTMKDETERAWNEVANEVDMQVAECKERWKNLRAVFVRHMKSSKSSPGAKLRKPYYLSEAMQFTAPFVKALMPPSDYPPSPPQQKEKPEQFEDNTNESISLSGNFPKLQARLLQSIQAAEISQRWEKLPESFTSNQKRPLNNDTVDKTFSDYFLAKKSRSQINLDHGSSENPKTEALKMFLFSMLPDLQDMTDEEVRRFKRKTLDTVDDIFSARTTIGPQVPVSSRSMTPSSQSEVVVLDQKPENAAEEWLLSSN